MPIIEVEHVTKEFRLGQLRTLKQSLSDLAVRLRGGELGGRAPFKALDDVDFTVEAGEVLGVIGHNGAGKSTLLKILAGISKPTHGRVAVRGKVAPLIEVGAGLVPDLTGRENIYINATILGMKRAEIERKFDEIVAFADLEEFIDTPLKRYSSGMQVRLGFSIATSVEADILIVDEVLAVGDLAFQRKCFDRMEELIKRQGRTVLLVSHNIRQVGRLCSRAFLMDHGRIIAQGRASDVCEEFYELMDKKILDVRSSGAGKSLKVQRSGEIDLLDVILLDARGAPTNTIKYGQGLDVRVRYRVYKEIPQPIFGVGVHTTDFVYLATVQSVDQIELPTLAPGTYEVACVIPLVPFLPGIYSLRVGVAIGPFFGASLYAENVAVLQVAAESMNRAVASHPAEGFVGLDAEWTLRSLTTPVAPALVDPEVQS